MPTYKTGDVVTSGVSAPQVGSAYQGLIDANPYRNAGYTVRPWQQFLSWLGFRTGADAWKENMSVQAQEYDQAILQKQYDEQYNSPSAQVGRMRGAGLNPDIDGGSSIDSGSAQNLAEDPSTPMQSTGDEAQLAFFADNLMNIFSTSLGLVGSVQGVVRNRLENQLISGDVYNQGSSLAERLATLFVPRSDESDFWDNVVDPWQNKAIRTAEAFAGRLPKKMRIGFTDYIVNFFTGALGDVKSYDELNNRLNSITGYHTTKSTIGIDDDSSAMEVLKIFSDEMGRLNKDILKTSKKAEIAGAESAEAEADYNKEYYQSLDGSVIAGSENAQAGFNETNMDMNTLLNDSIGRIIDRLDSASKDGGFKGGLASVAMALLAGLRLMMTTQGLPSVSRSSSSGSSSWSKGSGNAVRGSESMSIGW